MKYLSLFSGIEAASQAWEPLGWEPVAFCEIDRFPSEVLKYRYPNTPNLTDVSKITEETIEELGDIDLVVGGSPCFGAGTYITTKNGLVPIEDVKVGDYVITHKKQWKKVLRIGNKKADTIIVTGQGHDGIVTTENHPFYCCERKSKSTRENGKSIRKSWIEGPEWVEAKDLTGQHWASIAEFPKLDIPTETPIGNEHLMPDISVDLMWLAGAYLGDGWTRIDERRGSVLYGVNEDKAKLIMQRVDNIGLVATITNEKTSTRITLSKRGLARWLKTQFGSGAGNKLIPMWVLGMSIEYRQALLDGYMAMDGTKSTETTHRCSTISRKLAYGIGMLVNSLGYASSKGYVVNDRECVIEGRVVNENPYWTVTSSTSSRSSFEQDGLRYGLVRSVASSGRNETVYNLEVEDDNSYVADGIIVHNCQAFSVAGLRKGLADPRGNLTLEFLRVVSIVKPKWVLWENVPGVLSENTGALLQLMDGLNELGYHVDLTERDAQFFGVPQRRRRIFLTCKRADLAKSDDETKITNVEIVSKMLLGVLGEHLNNLGFIANKSLLSDVTMKPMREMVSSLAYDIKDWMKSVEEEYSDAETADDEMFGSLFEEAEPGKTPFIYNFFNDVLSDDLYNISMEEVAKCTQYLSNVCNYVRSNEELRESLLNTESLFSTAVQEYTNYAKKISSESYVKKHSGSPIDNISALSKENYKTLSDFRDWSSRPEVYSQQESVQWNSIKGRPQGEKATSDVSNCFREGGFGQYVEGEVGTLKASGGVLGGGSETFVTDAYTIIGDPTPKVNKNISGTLRASGGGGIVPPSVVYPTQDATCYNVTFCDANGVRADRRNGGLYVSETDIANTLTVADNNKTLAVTADTSGNHPVCYSFDALGSNSMKSSNPNSGCREVDIASCLDTTRPDPSKNQGGIAVISLASKQLSLQCYEDIASTLLSSDYKEPQVVVVAFNHRQTPVSSDNVVGPLDTVSTHSVAVQGSMIGRSDTAGPQGSGVNEDICFTLNTADRHAVAFGTEITNAIAFEPGWAQRDGAGNRFSEEITSTICSNMGDNQLAVAFLAENSATAGGIGYEEEKLPTLKSSGTPTVVLAQHDNLVIDPVAFQQNARDEVRLIGGDGQCVGALSASSGMHQTNYIAFTQNDGGRDATEELAPTLRSGGDGGVPQMAVACDLYNQSVTGDVASSLTTATGTSTGSGPKVLNTQVRRLTPIECERLQGFPKNWTQIPYRNKAIEDCPNGPRYKAIGNSMAVPVMSWLAEQIIKSDECSSTDISLDINGIDN